jgi:starch-binding outer membrane protein, SusD/RagB family
MSSIKFENKKNEIMIIKNNYFNFLICFALLFSACQDDILESIPYGESTSANFWRNGDDAIAAANAIYAPLLEEDLYGHGENAFDNCSDDLYRAGDWGNEEAMENFTLDASNSGVSYGWKSKYEIISRANAVLINVPNIENIDGFCVLEIFFDIWRCAFNFRAKHNRR